jgi:antitoxin VapB
MALYIKGEEVDRLAKLVQQATGARSKSDAVKRALENELARVRAGVPLSERLATAKALAAKIGKPNPAFDMKAFTDEMWSV